MRIALVIERMDLRRGGREAATAQMAEAMAGRGLDVTILCQQASWSAHGVNVRPLGRRGLTRLAKLRHFVADVQREMASGGYDVVHAMLPIPGAGVYQPRGGTVPAQRDAGLRRRGPLGGTIASLAEPLNRCRCHMADLERRVVADRRTQCLAVSYMVAQEFEQYYGRTEGVRTIYNAVALPAADAQQRADWRQRIRYKLGVRPGEPVFLTIATNFALKGIAEAIRAFARWTKGRGGQPPGRLVIVGRDLVESYERIASLNAVGSSVVFVPPAEDITQFYAAADAFILLSWYDPCSRVVLEATRWHLPSITTACNGAAEVLADGAGIVVSSPNDIRAVVAAMNELADEHRRFERAGACAAVAAELSMERHVDELMKVYAEVHR